MFRASRNWEDLVPRNVAIEQAAFERRLFAYRAYFIGDKSTVEIAGELGVSPQIAYVLRCQYDYRHIKLKRLSPVEHYQRALVNLREELRKQQRTQGVSKYEMGLHFPWSKFSQVLAARSSSDTELRHLARIVCEWDEANKGACRCARAEQKPTPEWCPSCIGVAKAVMEAGYASPR